MTVSTEVCYAQRNWTGIETSFAAGFAANSAAEVRVISRDAAGVETTLTINVHYTMTIGVVDKAVTVFPLALPAAPKTILLLRDTLATQPVNFANLGSYQPRVHTDLHDAAAMRDGEDKFHRARSVRAPLGETLNNMPRAADRAGKVLGFDGAGQPIATTGGGGGGGSLTDGDKGDITVSNSGATWTIDPNAVTYAKMQDVTATARFIGRISAGAGDPEELTGAQATTLLGVFTSGLKGLVPASGGGTTTFLRADGTFAAPPGGGVTDGDKGDITVSGGGATWTIDNDAVTYAKMQNVTATARLIGRITAGAGDPEELTGTQATTLLDLFTSGLKGLVPPSGGGTANFLRADGTFAAPPGGGGGLADAYAAVTDGTNTATALGSTTFKLRSADSKLSIVVTNNDATHGDNALLTVNEGNINAGNLTGGAALTKTDDTNVTLTLAGTPAAAVLKATSITVGWTGTLAAARLNANVVQGVVNDTNVTGTIAAQVLTLGWTGTLATARITDNAVTYAKMQDVTATARFIGRITAGAGDPEELTGTQATTLLDTFTSALKGLVPASGGGTTTFLRADGAFAAPPGGAGATRELLLANRTYFVRTDGSDANTGLVNSAGGAFLTIQKAVNVITTIDLNGFNVNVQVGDGTYTGAVVLKQVVGFSSPGCLVIQGNNAAPANVVVSPASGDCFAATSIAAVWDIKDLKVQASAGNGIIATKAGVRYGNINFGACANAHVGSFTGGYIEILSSYAISGGGVWHWICTGGSQINQLVTPTITLSGTPAFTGTFAYCFAGYYRIPNVTFSGAATGIRYQVEQNGVVYTGGAGAAYFPGNAAGTVATGGQYS